jgi:hypothetical protein
MRVLSRSRTGAVRLRDQCCMHGLPRIPTVGCLGVMEMAAMVLNLGRSRSIATSVVSIVPRIGSGGTLQELDVLVLGKRIASDLSRQTASVVSRSAIFYSPHDVVQQDELCDPSRSRREPTARRAGCCIRLLRKESCTIFTIQLWMLVTNNRLRNALCFPPADPLQDTAHGSL